MLRRFRLGRLGSGSLRAAATRLAEQDEEGASDDDAAEVALAMTASQTAATGAKSQVERGDRVQHAFEEDARAS